MFMGWRASIIECLLGASLKPAWVSGEPEACQTSPLGLQRVPLPVFGVSLSEILSEERRHKAKTLRRWQRLCLRTLISTHTGSYIYISQFAHKHTHYLVKTYPKSRHVRTFQHTIIKAVWHCALASTFRSALYSVALKSS